MLPIIAIIVGLGINYATGGLPFSALLCIGAGIFLIMPSLLQFKLKDTKEIITNKNLFILNTVLNIVVIPLLFWAMGFLFFQGSPAIQAGFAILGLLPGGGLLMSRINKAKGDTKTGFLMFAINMTLLLISFSVANYIIFSLFSTPAPQEVYVCEVSKMTGGLLSCSGGSPYTRPLLAYLFLILLPFVISRIVNMFSKLKAYIEKHKKVIQSIATLFVLTYIFSLQDIHAIFTQPFSIIIKIFLGVLTAYLLVVGMMLLLTDGKLTALFWNSLIRFLSLGLILSIVYIPILGIEYVIIFASAFIIQTFISTLLIRWQDQRKKEQ